MSIQNTTPNKNLLENIAKTHEEKALLKSAINQNKIIFIDATQNRVAADANRALDTITQLFNG